MRQSVFSPTSHRWDIERNWSGADEGSRRHRHRDSSSPIPKKKSEKRDSKKGKEKDREDRRKK